MDKDGRSDYELLERLPTLAEYHALCTAVGWGHVINFDAASASLARSVYGVVVTCAGEAVGMARLVGDGVMYCYVQDVAIHPAHQRRGIGRRIMTTLLRHIETQARGPVFVGLFSAAEAEQLYQQLDFSSQRDLTGMFRVVVGAGLQQHEATE
ncbi:MAG: GNAT family N-acetyltransferase [Chloroflexota bacterium]